MSSRAYIWFFLTAASLPAQGFGTLAAPLATDCAVGGTVVNAVTGEPIGRAMVTMGGSGGAGSATDASGRWSITNTTCGTRRPVATHVGFVPTNNLQGGSASKQIAVQLVSGSPVTDQKITLMPEASITGKVQDADGDPIEAMIQTYRVNMQSGKRVLNGAWNGVAGADGNFRIGGLPPGRYIVCANSPQITYPVGGGAGLIYRENCFPGPLPSGPATAMPVEAGREVRTAFTLEAIRGVRVRGSYSGFPVESPDASFRVMVQLIGTAGGNGSGVNAPAKPDGTFDMGPVTPGEYIVRASVNSAQAGAPTASAQATVDVGDSDVNGVTLAFQPSGSLSGTVRFEARNPAAGTRPVVEVNLSPTSPGQIFLGPIPRAQWDANHSGFGFAGVPVALYRLSALVNGNVQAGYVKSATLRGQDVLNQPFAVNGTSGPIEIVVSDDAGSIDITVNDGEGHPVAASVIMVPSTGMRRFLNSGDDGHAAQKSFPPGEYRAWAFGDLTTVPYAEDDWMAQNAGPGEKVTVTSGGSVNLTLKRIDAPAQ